MPSSDKVTASLVIWLSTHIKLCLFEKTLLIRIRVCGFGAGGFETVNGAGAVQLSINGDGIHSCAGDLLIGSSEAVPGED